MTATARICPTPGRPLESIRMSATSPRRDPALIREMWTVAALTLVGGMLRAWSIGRLGLVHFDEGIYALAGLWIFSPQGLLGLEPTTIAYAPPGFPFLVGLAYGCLGIGDIPPILVSIAMGTLTIPAVGWVASRTFGRGAGASAAAFAALSGPHIAFSRLALTDASFLLLWILAIGQGQRFLERPNLPRAVLLGLSVGLAQLFKYNGWIAGVLVALTAATWFLFRRDERSLKTLVLTWGWGLFAALLAAAVYWPWFRFVESHGGYAALLAHHRSYLGGFSSWLGHLDIQLAEARILSVGVAWQMLAGAAAAAGTWATAAGWTRGPRRFPRTLLDSVFISIICATELLGLVFVILFLYTTSNTLKSLAISRIHLVVGWVALLILTPCYHPYVRLWLPIEAFGWMLMGGGYAAILCRSDPGGLRAAAGVTVRPPRDSVVAFGVLCLFTFFFGIAPINLTSEDRISNVFAPTDSLRRACRAISSELPKECIGLRLYARPPVTFYLSGPTPVYPQPNLDRLLAPGDSRTWALLDMAMVKQQAGAQERLAELIEHWDVVRDVPTTLNLPTLLDIDPASATSGAGDRSASLRLLRPKRPGEVR
jgi:dolichyl-phosphate-mannose-protein mannosyltransferase